LVRAEWPNFIQGQFGVNLKVHILSLYFDGHMTQPSILSHLKELGIDISSGEIHNILAEHKTDFHEEKEEMLSTGLAISKSITVDDTGLRHKGKNGYCTHIGNEFFAYFKSTVRKSRINFLEILLGKELGYEINGYSIDYFKNQKVSDIKLTLLQRSKGKKFTNKSDWEEYLKILGIKDDHHIRKATEGALLGQLLKGNLNHSLVIVSDDAGQFDILRHALCWVHSERAITSLHTVSYEQDQLLKEILNQFWLLFRSLHNYKRAPTDRKRKQINAAYEELFLTTTEMPSLNKALKSLHKKKAELLMVLEEPEIPLTNNISERDIRDQAKKRKISAGTRSNSGRMARDTFMSLQKTCKKLGITFRAYLYDRISKENKIPQLNEIMKLRASDIYSRLPDY